MTKNNSNTITEIWKAIPGFSAYEVSNQGRVRSFCRWMLKDTFKWDVADTPQRILRPKVGKCGYKEVVLCKNGRHYHMLIHRLVLLAFVGPCPLGMEACHNDGKRNNNFLENLRWDSRVNNCADTKKHGSLKGIKHPGAKLTNNQIRQIRKLAILKYSQAEIGKLFNITSGNVSKIILRQLWTHIP